MGGRKREREGWRREKKERMKPKKGRYCRVLVLSQMGWARVLAGGDWPGLAIQRGARARDLCAGPISTEEPHFCVAGPNLDAARGVIVVIL